MNSLPSGVLALAFSALPAAAQCGTSGVDLVVGNLTGVNLFSNADGITAIMPAIVLCNRGSTPADWIATTSAHPAIAFSMLRYSVVGGVPRLETIGQSWAHHQSSALQQNACCVCTPGAIDELGAGCSTSSTGNAVGMQSQLDLRGAIDAQSGTFTWPPNSMPPMSSADRRLQVATSDLQVSGARYFIEAQIVSADDAAAGNRANNASYREVIVGAGPTFLLTGTTTIGSPVIDAWPSLNPGATVVQTAVPGEIGVVRVGAATTNLGDGFHAYEYALHDLDSHAGVRSFSVPIPLGVAVRAIEFRGASTHSGDPVDDAPWTVTQANGRVTWSTSDFATDPFANALRWGSTFRFRFEASAPPANGALELARFRPGTPDAWTVNGPVPAGVGGGGTYCYGDGTGTACPCGNASPVGAGAGCLHSLGGGGRLVRGGNASVSNDALSLFGSDMPNSSALYFQGNAQEGGGAGAAFGDGLRCVNGSVVRLGTHTNVAGASTHPGVGDLEISMAGGVAPGATRHYQVWYRNAASFCTASTFNLTNGVSVTWAP